MPSVFGFQEVRSKDISPIFFQYGTKSKLCWTLSPDAYYNQDNMTTSGRQAFYDWWEQQQGKCLIFQRNSWNTAWWMLTFLQRCCAQFKKNTQSLEHVNIFQEAIPFASAASLAQRRSFMPHESISIILKMGYDPARQFSMKPCRWLSLMSRNGRVIQHALNGG